MADSDTPAPAGFVLPEQARNSVVVYVTRFCAFCHLAERLLERHSIAHTRVDVSADANARHWLETATGRRTVPQIFVGGRSIGGYRELSALVRSGGLAG